MYENEKMNLSEELSDDELELVAGGKVVEEYLDEVNLPGGWTVTCYDCHARFPVSHGECPRCGSKHVLMTN